jgi:Reverse transcriptase (RNA-dependent DNA polymerase)/Endonuclease-reverse transcriptase
VGKKFRLANLDVYRRDRVSAGGGTAIVVRRGIEHYEVDLPQMHSLEANAVVVRTASGLLRLVAVYKPPQVALDTRDLDELLKDPTPTIFAGDLNCKHGCWNSRVSNTNGRALFAHSCSKGYAVLGPAAPTFYSTTQTRPDVLDIVITHNTTKSVSLRVLQELSSDHNPVVISYGDEVVEVETEPRLDLRRTDWDCFRSLMDDDLDPVNLSLDSPRDIDRCINLFTNSILSALARSTPQPRAQRNTEFDLPLHIVKSIKAKNRVRKLWQRFKLPSLKTNLNSMVTGIKEMIKQHVNNRWEKRVSSLQLKDESIWRLTKQLLRIPSKSPPLHGVHGLAYSNKDKANALADTLERTFTPHNDPSNIDKIEEVEEQVDDFITNHVSLDDFFQTSSAELQRVISKLKSKKAPGLDGIPNAALKELSKKSVALLANVFNAVLRLGYFPKVYRESKIVLFAKPGKDPQFPQNYRPISLLSGVSKILERIILSRIELFLDSNDILMDEQFGFRKRHSSNHQVLRITEHISKGFNENKQTAAVFLDIAQAFDRVWHEGLLCKLIHIGLPAYLIRVTASYLNRRSFKVFHQGEFSTSRPIEAGVPQGSLLAPTLFSIYINDIPRTPYVMLGVYADDTALIAQSWQSLQACKYLQRALASYESWCEDWRVKVNVSKSNAVLFTKQRTQKATSVTDLELFGDDIPWCSEAKYLGVTLDKTLSWRTNCKQLATRAKSRLGILGPVLNRRSSLSIENGIILYKTMVLPIMTFGSQIWGIAAKTQLTQLQRVQNRALRTATRAPWFVRNEDLHRDAQLPLFRDTVVQLATKFYEGLAAVPNPLITGLSNYEAEDVLRYKRPKNVLATSPRQLPT